MLQVNKQEYIEKKFIAYIKFLDTKCSVGLTTENTLHISN